MSSLITAGLSSSTADTNRHLHNLTELLSGTTRDAFGRLRVSQPNTLFESTLLHDEDEVLWDTVNDGLATITHNPDRAALEMDTTATIGSRSVRQTRRYIVYQPGKSRLDLLTGVLESSGGVAGIRSRIGVFDDETGKVNGSGGNGIFFELDGTDLYIAKRSFVTGAQVDTRIHQTDPTKSTDGVSVWSADKMDGNGNSGVNFDPSKSQIFWFDFEWLGVGTVRVGTIVDSEMITCHEFMHANVIDGGAYMSRATLPHRYEIENVSGSAVAQMIQICSTSIAEGGFNPRGKTWVQEGFNTDVDAAEEVIMCIRPDRNNPRVTINPVSVGIMSPTNPHGIIRVYISRSNGIYVGDSYSNVGDGSLAEFSETGGLGNLDSLPPIAVKMFSRELDQTFAEFQNEVLVTADIKGHVDELVVTCEIVGSANEDIYSAVQWQEWE